MSSSATNTLTKRRSSPLSSNRRSAKPGCCASSAFKRLGDGRRLDLHLGRVTRKAAQLRGNANGHSHLGAPQWSSMSNAAWNASRFGAIVAVGPDVCATASIVFSPWPVM